MGPGCASSPLNPGLQNQACGPRTGCNNGTSVCDSDYQAAQRQVLAGLEGYESPPSKRPGDTIPTLEAEIGASAGLILLAVPLAPYGLLGLLRCDPLGGLAF